MRKRPRYSCATAFRSAVELVWRPQGDPNLEVRLTTLLVDGAPLDTTGAKPRDRLADAVPTPGETGDRPLTYVRAFPPGVKRYIGVPDE